MHFILFGCIRDRLVALRNSVQNGSYYLGELATVWLPYETRYKTGRTSSKVRATKSHSNFSNERTRSTQLDSELTFWCVSYYLGAFGTPPFGCLTKLGTKRADLVQKFMPRSRIGIFRNKCTRSSPLDPKLTFWCVLFYMGAFGTVWLPDESRCKTGRTSAKVRATKSRRNFSQQMHPIHPIGP